VLDRSAGTQNSKIAVLADVLTRSVLRLQFRNVFPGNGGEPTLLPAIDLDHQMAGEAFDEPLSTDIAETLFCKRGRKRMQPGFPRARGNNANSGAKNKPIRRLVLIGVIGPSEPPTANEAPINIDCVRPFKDDRLFRRRPRRQSITERSHADVKRPACRCEWLLWLQDDSELGEVEATDENQRSGTQFSGMGAGMGGAAPTAFLIMALCASWKQDNVSLRSVPPARRA
jgi:hypothetical protein